MSATPGFPDDLTRALMREERAKEAAASAVASMTRAQVVEAVRLINLWPWLGDDALLVATGMARPPDAPPPDGRAVAVNVQLWREIFRAHYDVPGLLQLLEKWDSA